MESNLTPLWTALKEYGTSGITGVGENERVLKYFKEMSSFEE